MRLFQSKSQKKAGIPKQLPSMGDKQKASRTTIHRFLTYQKEMGNRAIGRLIQAKSKTESPTGAFDQEADISPVMGRRAADESKISEAPVARERSVAQLIVDDDATELSTGQMKKSAFLAQLRSDVCRTADEAMAGTDSSSEGCPYVGSWFDFYRDKNSEHIERALRKFAPETSRATTAGEYIPIVSARVRRSVETWAKTGEITGVPEELLGAMPGAGIVGALGSLVSGIGAAVSGLVGSIGKGISALGGLLFKGREGEPAVEEDPQAIQEELGAGSSLDSNVRSRMEMAFGSSFSRVRVHTDTQASQISDRLNARAFTVGENIAFGTAEYKPGTLIGDALIAHELAHVIQQDKTNSSQTPMQKGESEGDGLESDADLSAIAAVASIWGGAKTEPESIAKSAIPRLKSGLRLQRCSKTVTNRGARVSVLPSGRPLGTPDMTEGEADADLSSMGLLSKVSKVAPPTNDYDCHGFVFRSGKGWINDDQVPAILTDNGYSVTTAPAVGDIVIYRNGGAITHSGIITAVSGATVTKVRSKWGRLGLYDHAPSDVPSSYGSWTAYHTTRPGGHNLRQE
jgi:hypothetical protein